MGKITICSKLILLSNKDLALLKDLMRRWSSAVWALAPASGGGGGSPVKGLLLKHPENSMCFTTDYAPCGKIKPLYKPDGMLIFWRKTTFL